MAKRDEVLTDQAIMDAMKRSAGGLDLGSIEKVLEDGIAALQKQMTALKETTYKGQEFDAIARATAHVQKAIDGLFRLAQFAKGQPDSRKEVVGDWLKLLTDEELATVMARAKAKGLA